MKSCCVCLADKHLCEFSGASANKDGLDSRCKNCRKQSTNAWKSQNKEKLSELDKRWRAENQNRKLDLNRAYRARKANASSEPYSTEQVLLTYGNTCYICGFAIDLNAPRRVGVQNWQAGLHIDHVIPISKGGSDALENVRPSHGICNLKKSNTIVV